MMPSARVLSHRASVLRWKASNPMKVRAQYDLRNAIRRGEVEPQPCHCGRPAHGHHEDYAAPLDVEWLCARHHVERHRQSDPVRRHH